MNRLEQLAGEVAVVTPLRRNETATSALVPWAIVEEIREQLTLRGYDWEAAALELRRLHEKRRRGALALGSKKLETK